MAETREPEAKKRTLKDQSVNLTDSVARVVRAGTGAATDVSVGAVNVAAKAVTAVTKGVADAVTSAVEESASVARKSVDRFFSTLDSAEKEPSEKTP